MNYIPSEPIKAYLFILLFSQLWLGWVKFKLLEVFLAALLLE